MQKAAMATFIEDAGASTDSLASLEIIPLLLYIANPTPSTE